MDTWTLVQLLVQRTALRGHARWSRADLDRHQARALARLREHAVRCSPFYAERHRGLERAPLSELPVVTKRELMASFERAVTVPGLRRDDLLAHLAGLEADEPFRGRWQLAATSGTTGLRGVFVWSPTEWRTMVLSYARAQEWAGHPLTLRKRARMAVVSSVSPAHVSARVGRFARSPLADTLRIDATEPLASICERLSAWRPEMLVAYASMASLLAAEQLAGRLRIAPSAVFPTSEALSRDERDRIRRAWGVEPFDVYVATETAGIASECARHAGLHLYEDLVIAEVVDESNRPVPPGEFGAKVLVTVLFSRTMPLIRYELSDSLRISPATCACGLPFRLVEAVEGRREDFVELQTRAGATMLVHPNVFHAALEHVAVAAWQVRADEGRIRVLLVGAPESLAADELASHVARAIRQAGAEPPAIEIVRVDAIPRTAIGKAPLVVALEKDPWNPLPTGNPGGR